MNQRRTEDIVFVFCTQRNDHATQDFFIKNLGTWWFHIDAELMGASSRLIGVCRFQNLRRGCAEALCHMNSAPRSEEQRNPTCNRAFALYDYLTVWILAPQQWYSGHIAFCTSAGTGSSGWSPKGKCGNKLDSHANCGLVWSWQLAARDENKLREEQNIDDSEPEIFLGGIGPILTSSYLPFSPTKSFSPLRRSQDG